MPQYIHALSSEIRGMVKAAEREGYGRAQAMFSRWADQVEELEHALAQELDRTQQRALEFRGRLIMAIRREKAWAQLCVSRLAARN